MCRRVDNSSTCGADARRCALLQVPHGLVVMMQQVQTQVVEAVVAAEAAVHGRQAA